MGGFDENNVVRRSGTTTLSASGFRRSPTDVERRAAREQPPTTDERRGLRQPRKNGARPSEGAGGLSLRASEGARLPLSRSDSEARRTVGGRERSERGAREGAGAPRAQRSGAGAPATDWPRVSRGAPDRAPDTATTLHISRAAARKGINRTWVIDARQRGHDRTQCASRETRTRL